MSAVRDRFTIMHAEGTLDLNFLLTFRSAVQEAVDAGWTASDNGRLLRLIGPLPSSPLDWEGLADLETYVVSAMARAERRDLEVSLHQVNGQWEVLSLPEVQPDQWFSDAEKIGYAKMLWEHQISAVPHLGLSWTVQIDLSLENDAFDNEDVRVSWDPASIDTLFSDQPLTSLGHLVPRGSERRTYISLLGNRGELAYGSLTVVSLDSLQECRLHRGHTSPSLSGELVKHPSTAQLVYSGGDREAWPEVAALMMAACCTSIWTEVASGSSDSTLEFFGYKRVEFPLPNTWTEFQMSGACTLRDWAFSQKSPDRLLAVRQIISLYTDSPFDFVEEILASADPIYFALRSDATAEALRDTRDAETHAHQAVRLTAQGSVDLTKSAGERSLAGLIAVGAAAIANVTKVLDASVTTTILGFIGGYFIVILLLFLFIDRRAIALPIEQLDSELRRKVTYLSPSAINSILTSPTIVGARKLVRDTRIAIALLYGGIIVALATAVFLRLT